MDPAEISQLVNGELINNGLAEVTGINEIHKVVTGDITFVDHPKYYDRALGSAASFVIIDKKVDCPEKKAILISDDPFRDYNVLTRHFRPFQPLSHTIAESASIGESTHIQPGVVIGNQVTIGEHCLIHPNVCIYDHTTIGDHVIIHAGTVIGSDAFYYKGRESGYDKLHSCGRVIIHDHVEIGSACTIDKGVSGETIIGEGTKIDNQVHIGHGVVIGKHCLFAAQVGIAGKTTIGDHVILWGQVGVSKDLTIGDHTVILAQSGVGKSLEGHKTYFGSPVQEAREKMKEIAAAKKLPEIWAMMKGR